LISLIVLIICSGRATAFLKKHGYEVGFVGVSKNTLKELTLVLNSLSET
jgi:hypothetical protein